MAQLQKLEGGVIRDCTPEEEVEILALIRETMPA